MTANRRAGQKAGCGQNCPPHIRTSLLLALICASALLAQTGSSIYGKVVDATGASISGATVTVKSVETGAVRDVATGEDGSFLVLSLPVGQYEVHIQKNGFREAVRTGINLAVAQQAVVNLQMEVGEFAQTVTISGEAQLINTTTDPVSGLVGERQVKDLPLNGRSFDNLVTLNPGAINYTAMKSPNTTTSDGNGFSIAGRRPGDNLFLWNGIEYTGASQLAVTPGGVSGDMLGIDAIREFNLLTDTYGAEYGKRSGAQVVVVTQSGANSLHGSVFEFLRNSALDSPGIFDQGVVPPFRRNQFGGSLGGPLKKDKLFLFGNYEGYRQSLAVSSVSVVPDTQARLGNLTTAAGVVAPVTGLDKRMLPFMGLWPLANGPELLSNGLPSGSALAYYNPKNTVHEDFGTLRADYNLRDPDRLSVSYMNDTGNSIIPLADPLFSSALALGAQVASVEETHVVSPSILNTFRAGFSRGAFNYDAGSYVPFPAGTAFVQGAAPGAITISSGITAAGGNVNAGVWDRRNLFTYTDSAQIVKGIHQITSGVWFQRVQENEDTASRRLGMATFSTLTTFLQGTLTNFQVVPNHNALGWRSWFGAWYVQDSIKLRRNLTVQLGLRHEFTNGWNEDSGRASNYVTGSNGVLLTAPLVGKSVYTQNNAKKLFSPRVGLAWDPFGNQKTAVRAGFGTYYSLIDVLTFLVNSLPPSNGSAAFTGSLPAILPITPNVPVPPSCGAGVLGTCTTYAPQGIQPDARTPTVEEWNLSVEQQLSRNMSLRVSYVGSHGYHGMLSVDPNTIPPQVCQNASGCTAGGSGTARATVPQGTEYIALGGRPNPYLSAGFFWYTEGNTSYNALQTDITRRLAQGLQFRANYTWSKNLDMNSGLTVAQANNQPQMVMNRNDVPRDWGPAALNATHQASMSLTYELPFGRSFTGLQAKLIRGWQVNGITTLLTGFPYTPLIGANRSGDGNTRNPDRPSLNPAFTGPITLGTQAQWFNPNAFALPTVGTFGNLGRGTYTGPGLAEVDMSIFKNTNLTERLRLQFRAEFFNLLNRTNLGSPNTTVFSGASINASAGLITALTTTPRQIQFGLKLMF